MSEKTAELGLDPVGGKADSRAKRRWRLYAEHENAILGILGVAAFLAVWEWAGTTLENGRLFFSSPSLVAAAFARMMASGEIWNDIWVSFQEFAIGYAASIVVAIPLGIGMGWYRRLNALLEPLVSAFYATPRVALVPLIIIWFGIGIYSKIAVVFLGAFFQILITTIAGVRNLDESLIKAARSFGANDRQIFLTVALPGSVPFILTGLKLAVGRALIGVVVGEMVAAEAGVGYMMTRAGATFDTSAVMVGVLIIAAFGVVSMEALERLERRFQAWRPQRVA
ncbi:MAG: ABC transporter permease [Betaproteobacteria bacterium]|nr:ABC transporter permease [Betaproteobacteria bacterium]